MAQAECARVAERWLEKYGEAIDCAAIRDVASAANLEKHRLSFMEARVCLRMAEVLERQAKELGQELERPAPGSNLSLFQQLQNTAQAIEEDPSATPISAKDAAAPTLLVPGLIEAMDKGARWLRERAQAVSPAVRDAATLAPDLALGRACFEISEWIRARHRRANGMRDGRTSWPDVVKCLEWHGNDISLDADKARHYALRWQEVAGRVLASP